MIKKIIHIAVALMILISITGFTISMHYCHDQLVDLGLFAPAHSCCESGDHHPGPAGNQINMMDHCVDKSLHVGSTDDYVAPSLALEFNHVPDIDLLLSSINLYDFQGSDDFYIGEVPWHKEPPPVQEVILSQIQTYLI